jgi:hypothetical protein
VLVIVVIATVVIIAVPVIATRRAAGCGRYLIARAGGTGNVAHLSEHATHQKLRHLDNYQVRAPASHVQQG